MSTYPQTKAILEPDEKDASERTEHKPRSGEVAVPIPLPRRFSMHSYSSPSLYDLKAVGPALPDEQVVRLNRECVLVQLDGNGRLFVFQFGSAVFCDVPPEQHPRYLTPLQRAIKQPSPLAPRPDLTTEDIVVEVRGGTTQVTFHTVIIPGDDIHRLHLIALMLARSSALELVENEVTEFLEQSEQLTNALINPRGTLKPWGRHKLLRFLGRDLATRHRIVNRFALFDMPERAWNNEEYYTLHRELFEEFDLGDRLETVERMLNVSSRVSSILLDLANARQSEFLEIIVILLIAVELLNALL